MPTLKGRSELAWRIEYDSGGFHFQDYEINPDFLVDAKNKRIRFELQRDVYKPVGVLKALVKIGLTLIPSDDTCAFSETIA